MFHIHLFSFPLCVWVCFNLPLIEQFLHLFTAFILFSATCLCILFHSFTAVSFPLYVSVFHLGTPRIIFSAIYSCHIILCKLPLYLVLFLQHPFFPSCMCLCLFFSVFQPTTLLHDRSQSGTFKDFPTMSSASRMASLWARRLATLSSSTLKARAKFGLRTEKPWMSYRWHLIHKTSFLTLKCSL